MNLTSWSEEKDKSIELSLSKFKQKKERTEFTVSVRNKYPFMVVIPEGSFRYEKNGEGATPSDANPRWVLKSGDMVTLPVKFTFHQKSKGKGTLTLQHIYAGEEVDVTESKTTSNAGGVKKLLFFKKRKDTETVSNYTVKSAVEGTRLPDAVLETP